MVKIDYFMTAIIPKPFYIFLPFFQAMFRNVVIEHDREVAQKQQKVMAEEYFCT